MAAHSSFLAGKSHEQRNLVGYRPGVGNNRTWLSNWAHMHSFSWGTRGANRQEGETGRAAPPALTAESPEDTPSLLPAWWLTAAGKPLTSNADFHLDGQICLYAWLNTLLMPQISSEVQKRRRICFLITSKSAWQTELSTCPSWDGLPDLAKIPICFFCGGLGKGVLIQVPTERIRESWTKCLAQTNKEPQFWIKVKLLRNCTTLFWVFCVCVGGVG